MYGSLAVVTCAVADMFVANSRLSYLAGIAVTLADFHMACQVFLSISQLTHDSKNHSHGLHGFCTGATHIK